MNLLLALLLGLAGIFNQAHFAPDLSLTPGALNSSVTQANIQKTICKPGFSSTIRPASSYTSSLKLKQLKSGYAVNNDLNPSHYEEDHLISLEIGGSPKSVANLWPEYYDSPLGARVKDLVENKLHGLVCSGAIPLKPAQALISQNWVGAYESFVKPLTAVQALFMNSEPLPSANPLATTSPMPINSPNPSASASNSFPSPEPKPSDSSSPSPSQAPSPTASAQVSASPTPTPAPSPSPSVSLPPVSAGAYCASVDAGKKGVGANGSTYTCKVSATDARLRWRI
jgi:hypothetical protein